MTSWVKEHAPPFRCGLLVDFVSPEPNSFGFRLVQVVCRETKVYLLGEAAVGPLRRSIVRNSDCRQPSSISLHGDEIVANEGDLTTYELSP